MQPASRSLIGPHYPPCSSGPHGVGVACAVGLNAFRCSGARGASSSMARTLFFIGGPLVMAPTYHP